uniref:Glucose-methanol-choline oxidoreductase N-terminal domain-containing protein n=1 Tax=Psilocybe cubensis TaxID=181762 RepID=A0A8H7XWN7_PSICU
MLSRFVRLPFVLEFNICDMLVSAAFFLGILPLGLGITIADPSELTTFSYDYIIVGGGTAGLVVANRLTENPNITVAILEAAWDTQFGWNYTVVPQAGLNLRTFDYPRGKAIGGCSAVNYLIHQFGTDEDWDRFANLTSEPSWSWANMKQYVQKYKQIVKPLDGHNITGKFNPSLHGFSGMVQASLPELSFPIDGRIAATLDQLSSEFKFNNDTLRLRNSQQLS